MVRNKIRTLVGYSRAIARKAKKKAKPLARKILSESIKLERIMESEAKKVLNEKSKKKRRR
jgi:hypothetical protein